MKKLNSIFFIIVIILFACKQGIEADKQYIRGRLFLVDTITQNTNGIPVANRKVFLHTPQDSLNFLYTAVTNTEGYFSFTLPFNDQNDFVLRTYDTSKGIEYGSRENVKRGQTNVVLTETINFKNQNGIVGITTDPFGVPMAQVKVYLFTNFSLALQNNPAGVVDSFLTTKEGKFQKIKISPGYYYVNASKRIDTAEFIRLQKTITIPALGLLTDTIQLQRKITIPKNGFTLFVKDSLGGSVSNATVYLYTSSVLAVANTLNGVYANYPTDALGKLSKNDLPSGEYFVNVTKVVADTVIYQKLGHRLNIPVSSFITDTIIVLRKR